MTTGRRFRTPDNNERRNMYTNSTQSNGTTGFVQRRLFPLHTVREHAKTDELQLRNWTLTDMKALAIDPDVEIRRMAALSRWVVDADLQWVLATDPDETVVLNLLTQVDPGIEATQLILTGPHLLARRELARRNLLTATLLTIMDDPDDEVRRSARSTLKRRGVRAGMVTA